SIAKHRGFSLVEVGVTACDACRGSKYPLPQVEPRVFRTRPPLPRAPSCRGRLEQPLLRGIDECTSIVRDASKTRRGPTVYEVMSFEHPTKRGSFGSGGFDKAAC